MHIKNTQSCRNQGKKEQHSGVSLFKNEERNCPIRLQNCCKNFNNQNKLLLLELGSNSVLLKIKSCHLVKFMFSKKATKFDEIFTIKLMLCSKFKIKGRDFVNFCGLLKKHELYGIIFEVVYKSLSVLFYQIQTILIMIISNKDVYHNSVLITK